jgi:hypothetical protein
MNEDELQKQDSLILFILDGEPIKGTLIKCSLWYSQYLQSQIRYHWSQLTVALANLDDNSPHPKPGELVVVYDFLLLVARLLKYQKDLSLVDVVDELDNESMLKPQLDEERATPNQVAFAALGWLSMTSYLLIIQRDL